MALETGTYISDLNVSNPVNTDGVTQADDHLRLIKSTVKATFPNVSGAVLPTHTELNYVDGVTSALQTQLDARAVLASANTFTGNQTITGNLTVSGAVTGVFPTGTRMLFQQTSAPTGWTKDATHNDKALRVVSGTVSSGGTADFSSAFASRTVSGNVDNFTASGTVNGHTLDITQIPSHQHFIANETNGTGTLTASNYVNEQAQAGSSNGYILKGSTTVPYIGLTSPTGGGTAHSHSFTGTAHNHSFSTTLDMAVKYVDLIIASKD